MGDPRPESRILHLGAEIDIAMLATKGDVGELHKAIQGLSVKPAFPHRLLEYKVAANPALTYTFLDLMAKDQVPPAKVWDVKRYHVYGPDPFTTLAGVTVIPMITAGQLADTSTEPIFPEVLDVAATVPRPGSWAAGSLVLRFGEHLVFCFKGLGNGQQVYATAQVMEYDLEQFFANQ